MLQKRLSDHDETRHVSLTQKVAFSGTQNNIVQNQSLSAGSGVGMPHACDRLPGLSGFQRKTEMNQLQVTVEKPAQTLAPIAAAVDAGFPTARYMLINRPQSGNGKGLLAAHTAALFEALGLYRGESVSRETLVRTWGPTAIDYHQGSKGLVHADNPAFDVDGIGAARRYSLNDAGFDRFAIRGIDPESVATFFDLITEGKTNRACHPSFLAVKAI